MKRIILFTILILVFMPAIALAQDSEDHSICDPSKSSDYAELLKTRQRDTNLMWAFAIIGVLLVFIGRFNFDFNKMKLKKRSLKTFVIISIIGIIFLLLALNQQLKMHEYDFDTLLYGFPGDTHEHGDFIVYIKGEMIDFTKEKYMTTEESIVSKHTHLHDMEGSVAHKHATGVTWRYLFETLGIEFTKQCFIMDTGERYCNDNENKLLFFVNGKSNNDFGNYEIRDLDKVLITYGPMNSERIVGELEKLTDNACLYSGSCPERGDKSLIESCTIG